MEQFYKSQEAGFLSIFKTFPLFVSVFNDWEKISYPLVKNMSFILYKLS